ncbi:PilN domain-containing protein [Porticoccaceae bacterium LTM1]|nr:PilN domain-containing protein [Porticoccaceae bacterium LTM1]
MALINLLPWREEHRQEKKKEFLSFLAVVLIFAGLCSGGWWLFVDGQIVSQEDRNRMLQEDIMLLDKDLAKIADLKKTKSEFLERMEVIQGLQGNRSEIVKLFDELAKAIPDGVFFTEVTLNGSVLSMNGYSESYTRVSALMRNLNESYKFDAPDLDKMEADRRLGEDGQRFEMRAKVVKPEGLNGDGQKKGGQS